MRKKFGSALLSFFILVGIVPQNSNAQAGWWTWISGSNVPGAAPVYGTQGVPSVINHPGGQYEQTQWKDKQGNFWLYGGMYPSRDDLWKYNPVTNEWTWMQGTGTGSAPVYGTMGVSSPLNYPGARSYGAGSWTDTTGNLWLFGGTAININNDLYNDLWKYDISTNEWTWINGSSTSNTLGSHGVVGIPGPLVQPGGRNEAYANWVDAGNNLWLFGGSGLDEIGTIGMLGDLMKYDISTNEWTWMKGSYLANQPANFGTLGVSNPANDPGSRYSTAVGKDLPGNFMLFGGRFWGGMQTGYRNDVWKYDPLINEWTWIDGPSTPNDTGSYQSNCAFTNLNQPRALFENRATVSDNCGNLWMFGGLSAYDYSRNDLLVFSPQLLQWNWVSGNFIPNPPGNWGIMGNPSSTNIPSGRFSGVAWWGNDNRFYMFGGPGQDIFLAFADMWVYTPDSNCINVCNYISAGFTAPDEICPGTCINFINQSTQANAYQWIFNGGSPAASNDTNPQNICYNTPGSYDVTLIAFNSSGSDTLTVSNSITVFPFPSPQSIIQNGDTLFADAGSAFYQWYLNGNPIPGATDYYYVATVSGGYNVVATDVNGCEVEAVIINVIADVMNPYSAEGSGLSLFPNPVERELEIRLDDSGTQSIEVNIYNLIGVKIYSAAFNQRSVINCSQMSPGIYTIDVRTSERKFRTKFIKE